MNLGNMEGRVGMKDKQKPIFISHSSKDKALADKLADLLTTGCGVHPNDILCTSLEGKGIPAGTSNFIEYLRGQIQDPKLVVLLLSENFFASQFCICELGAVWGMNLTNFPLVVPPMTKGKVKATLMVAQMGSVTDEVYLDELRDVVGKELDAHLPTPTWTIKRDGFLKSLDPVLKSLPVPDYVSADMFKEAQERYQAALADISVREQEVEKLKAQIVDLSSLKDAAQVKKVNRKYTKIADEFERLCDAAAGELRALKTATVASLFYYQSGNEYFPTGDEWDDVKKAEDIKEVETKTEDKCIPRTTHPRVRQAIKALKDLRKFVDTIKEEQFFKDFEAENQFEVDITNKEFWQKYLVKF